MTGNARSRTAKLSLSAAVMAAVCLLLVPTAYADDSSWFASLFSGADQHAAVAKTVDGRVSVLRDLEEWAVEVGTKIKVRQTVITGKDGRATFEVADGSTWQVFPNSRVVFRKNSGDWRELLDVMLGRVRVKIEHLGNEPNPNKVHTPSAVISVRGTTFDISVDGDETTTVEVEEGTVEVTHALLGGGRRALLNAGDSITVYRNAPIAKGLDKGGIMRQVVRIGLEAAGVAARGATNPGATGGTIGGGAGGGIGGVGGVGDTDPGTSLPEPPSSGTSLPTPPSSGTGLPTPPSGLGLPSIP